MKTSISQSKPVLWEHPTQLTHRRVGGFTLAEVLLSILVIGLGLSTSIICLQIGMRQNDTARWTTYVTQVLQDEAETIRLNNWTGILAYPDTATFYPTGNLQHPLDLASQKFTFTREISNVNGESGLKNIVLTAEWTGISNDSHQLRMAFNYAENGMHDYYYGTQ